MSFIIKNLLAAFYQSHLMIIVTFTNKPLAFVTFLQTLILSFTYVRGDYHFFRTL